MRGLTRPRPLATCRAAAAARAPAPPPHGRTAASAMGRPAQQAALAALLRTQHMPSTTHTPPISRTCKWLRVYPRPTNSDCWHSTHFTPPAASTPLSLSGAVSLLLPAVRTCVTPWAQPLALWDPFEWRLQAAHVEAPQAGVTLQHRVASAAPAAGAHLQTHSRCTPMQQVATGSVINSATTCPSHQASTSTPHVQLQGCSRAWVLRAS